MTELLTHPAGPVPHCGPINSPKEANITPQGLRAWLPALVVLVGMPLLALMTTKYVLVSPMQQFSQRQAELSTPVADNTVAVVSLKKNLTYTASDLAPSHPLNSNILLILANGAFKEQVTQDQDKLAAIATSALKKESGQLKTSAAKTNFRVHLMSELNQSLGGPIIRELYIAGWPAQ